MNQTEETPNILPEATATLAGTRFLSLYDLAYDDGSHYFETSRRQRDDLLAFKPDDELKSALPDAVSCCLVLEVPGEEPRMVLFHEYRYPAGQYLLSVPSGLIDTRDCGEADPLVVAMTREIDEECGLTLGEGDSIYVINRFLFNTPGMTDESTALLCAVARRESFDCLSHAGAEGSERFADFELLTKAQVRQVLATGRDAEGRFYPMVAWAAMTYFACDLWREGF